MARHEGDLETLAKLRLVPDARSIDQMRADARKDGDFEEGVITDVTEYDDGGYSITFKTDTGSSVGTGIPAGPEGMKSPEVGDNFISYGRFGYPTFGADVRSESWYFLTPWERFAKRMEMLAEFDREDREEFERNQAAMDKRYEALPAPLKRRIDRFRAQRPDFRISGEAYEMAACADAPKIARALAEKNAWLLDEDCKLIKQGMPPAELIADGITSQDELVGKVIKDFHDLSYEEQKKIVPDLDEGHSGNTFDHAVKFAGLLLLGEEL